MFQNKRYVSKGVANEVPLEIQIYLWGLIDALVSESKSVDYLQVFELVTLGRLTSSNNLSRIKVTHKQE